MFRLLCDQIAGGSLLPSWHRGERPGGKSLLRAPSEPLQGALHPTVLHPEAGLSKPFQKKSRAEMCQCTSNVHYDCILS